MIKKLVAFLIVAFLVYSPSIQAQNQKVEVFNIEMGKVVKDTPSTSAIQKEAKIYLKSINGIYKKLNPLPPKGIIVRIPLIPPLKVQNQWIHTLADEMNIIFPAGGNPYVMIYDDENNTYFFTIESHLKTNRMSKYLGITLKKGDT
ncbi:hypothetical protein F7731_11000 [Cytobacillus depressus]|uniref:Uncharacterized protein n=1 Tax=Cytobacillus depressus TaxID=1602942 RepID=A0A6L3VAC1_9BACI|nr:hypothetical protein [Cytobacillus depressus]KAB2336038.1 hypothetical protein F7731_11000 [Cytobacillus depressus]